MKKHLILSLLFCIVLCASQLLLIASCKKSKKEAEPEPTVVTATEYKIVGIVKDETGLPIAGANVTNGSNSVTTNSNGFFEIKGIATADGRCAVAAKKDGFFAGSKGCLSEGKQDLSFEFVLQKLENPINFTAASGTTATMLNGGEVSIPANGLKDANGNAFTGNATLYAEVLNPNDPNFSNMVAGDDLQATTTSGAAASLFSYGIMRVELRGNAGQELNLAAGKTSTIKVPIDPADLATAPATIPLWYLDESTGIWKEEGVATKTGNEYVGTVTHFTDWNCDKPGPNATITGLLLDCNNLPLKNTSVKVGQTTIRTDNNGNFSRRVPSGIAFTVESNNYLNFPPANVPALTVGQTYNVGTLVSTVCPAFIEVNLNDCNGQPFTGTVLILYENAIAGNGSLIWTSNDKKIAVKPNATYNLTVFSGFNFTTTSVVSGNSGTTVSTTLNACGAGQTVSTANFTINGGIFSNETFVLDPNFQIIGSLASAEYDISSNRTDIIVLHNVASNPYSKQLVMQFAGNTTGAYTINNNSNDVSLTIQKIYSGDTIYAILDNVNPGSINVNTYGAVGSKVSGTISGTFSGSYFKLNNPAVQNPLTNIAVNGTFEAVRKPDKP
jgi:hypothetical protein